MTATTTRTTTRTKAPPFVAVFSPAQLHDHPPPTDARIVVVRFCRRQNAFADACADLRDAGYQFTTVWVEGVGETDSPEAERLLARSLAMSYGQDGPVHVYGDELDTLTV